MRRLTAGFLLAMLTGGSALASAQTADTTQTPPPEAAPAAEQPESAPPPQQKSTFKEKIYYGGSVSLAFGGATQIGIFPMIGYKLTPKLSMGVEVGYQFVDYDDIDASSHNYGGSVFGRFRPAPPLYAHAEYQVVNYEVFTARDESSREIVPFLLVGGGVVKSLGARSSAYVEVLFDVLQDENSPYEDWEPVVTVGVAVGF